MHNGTRGSQERSAAIESGSKLNDSQQWMDAAGEGKWRQGMRGALTPTGKSAE